MGKKGRQKQRCKRPFCGRVLGKIAGILVFSALLLYLSRSAAWSAPPFKGVVFPENQETCHVNPVASGQRSAALKAAPYFPTPISPTTAYVLVIRVDFPDKSMGIFGNRANADSFMESVKDFYLENSYGILSVSATVTTRVSGGSAGAQGAYRMPTNHGSSGSGYANGLSSNYSQLAQDAVSAADPDYDLAHATSVFTSASSGRAFDHVMIFHAGDGAETTTPSSSVNIWSVFVSTGTGGITPPFQADGVKFNGAVFVPESEQQGVNALGVICHEYGHQLGLPDLYVTPSQSAVGKWSLMDAGLYLGATPGANPGHLDPWSKLYLGFLQPETLGNVALTSRNLPQVAKNRTGAFRLPISNSSVGSGNEYFLVEYRRKGGFGGAVYDADLPGQGLLVWYIDETIASNATRLANNNVNSGSPNRGIDLVEADGSDSGLDQGSGGDPFPGTSGARLFEAPKANAFNGQDSGFEISNISDAGQSSMSFSIGNPFFNPAFAARSDSVVVTGGLNGYVNPLQGDKTIISARPTVSGTIDFKIYTLTGNLVWQGSANGTAGQETKIRWRSVNEDGETVGSGIYLLHVNGGGIDEKKKIAIIK